MAFDGNTIGTADARTFTGLQIVETFNISGSDVDMMAVSLVAGRVYEIDVDNGNDSLLRIFDAFGNEVKRNDDGFDDGEAFGLNPYTQFLANYTGTYYFAFSPYYLDDYNPASTLGRVSPENSLAAQTSDVTITDLGTTIFPDANSINSITAKGFADESDLLRTENEGPLRAEYVGSTIINPGTDVEMGRVDLAKGETIVVDVNGRIGADTLDGVIRVFDDLGTQIGFDNGGGGGVDSELVFVAPNSDDFYIAISGEGNSTYNATDGTGTTTGDTGEFTVIIHRNPTLIGGNLSQNIGGTTGADYIVLLAGSDTSDAGAGNDIVAGGDGGDSLLGGDGEDTVYGEFDGDTLDGGRGRDVVVGGDGNDSLTGGTGSVADMLQGGDGNDTLSDGNGADTLLGDAGNDSMNAGAFNNRLEGGDGNDTLLAGDGADTMLGGAGNDSLNASDGLNNLDGGLGLDTIRGGADADTIFGGLGTDSLFGLDGADTISGGGDADTLNGGLGNDTLSGDFGNDVLIGGVGADVFDFNAVAELTDTINDLVLGTDRIDLTGIFGAGVVNSGNLSQYIQTSTAGVSDSFLAVDANGLAGGLSFTIIAQVNGVTAAALFDANNYIL